MFSAITSYLWQGTSAVLAVLLITSSMKSCSLEKDLLKEQAKVQRVGRVLSDERAASAANLSKAQGEARTVEQNLQKKADLERKERDEKINSLSTEHAALSKRVRDAEARAKHLASDLYGLSRTTQGTGTGGIVPGDSGTVLLATIGQEDVDEASRADTIRVSLQSCYASYREVRDKINRMGSTQ